MGRIASLRRTTSTNGSSAAFDYLQRHAEDLFSKRVQCLQIAENVKGGVDVFEGFSGAQCRRRRARFDLVEAAQGRLPGLGGAVVVGVDYIATVRVVLVAPEAVDVPRDGLTFRFRVVDDGQKASASAPAAENLARLLRAEPNLASVFAVCDEVDEAFSIVDRESIRRHLPEVRVVDDRTAGSRRKWDQNLSVGRGVVHPEDPDAEKTRVARPRPRADVLESVDAFEGHPLRVRGGASP